MIYPFMTIKDDIEVVHTELREDNTVKVYFEQPIEGGFKSIECVIPTYDWGKNKGFEDEELIYLDGYVHSVADIILELAQEGGFDSLEHKKAEVEQTKKHTSLELRSILQAKIQEVPEKHLESVISFIDYIINN